MANYRLSEGVQQDHKGRLYRQAFFPSGKFAGIIWVKNPTAETERAVTIPVIEEVKRRPILRAKSGVASNHKAVVEWRYTGESMVKTMEVDSPAEAQQLVDEDFRPLMRFDGKEWHVVGNGLADYYVQYHHEVANA